MRAMTGWMVVALAAGAGTAEAAGDLDLSFAGGAGYVLVPFGGQNDQAAALLRDSAGRLLLGGFTTDAGNSDRDMALARLLPDGTIDPSFGVGGLRTVSFDLGGFADGVRSIRETASGGYLLCGIAEDQPGLGGVGQIALARLTANGALDTSFDFDGRRTLSVAASPGWTHLSTKCALQPDGRILVAGTTTDNVTAAQGFVARLQPDGGLDSSFGDAGVQLLDLATGTPAFTVVLDVAVDPSGRVLVAGATNNGAGTVSFDGFVSRLGSNGSLDPGFGTGGTRRVALDQGGSNSDTLRAIALTADGKVVLAGTATTASGGLDALLVRLLADGNFDPEFGTAGRALFGYDGGGSNEDLPDAVAVDAKGRVYAAGSVQVGEQNGDLAVLRVGSDGLADPGFGSGGWVTFGLDVSEFQDSEFASAMTLDPQGRVLAAGGGYGSDLDMLVVRLTSDQVFADGFETTP